MRHFTVSGLPVFHRTRAPAAQSAAGSGMRLSDLQPRIVQTGHIARRPDAAKILSAHHLIRKVLQLSGMMRFRPSTYPKSLTTFWVDGVPRIILFRKVLQLSGMMRFRPSTYPKSLATFWVDGVNPSAYPKSRVAGRPCNFSD
jgi:hypothetical protein